MSKNNIRYFRELRNLTQEQMAEQLCIATSTYGKIERGETDIIHNKLSDIARILQVEMHQLLPEHTINHFQNSNIHFGNIQAETYNDNKTTNNNSSESTLALIELNQQLIETQKLMLELLQKLSSK